MGGVKDCAVGIARQMFGEHCVNIVTDRAQQGFTVTGNILVQFETGKRPGAIRRGLE